MKHADVTPALVAAETDRVASTAASFRNDAVLAPSLCAGWSRGHVLAHLARNADALVRVCDVALTGTADTMYDDVDSRDADIERGARRSAHDHATDIRDTAARLAERLEALHPEHADVRVERTPGAFPIPVGMVPFMRLREVVYHHVDLDAGYTFASAPPEVVSLFLRDAANRLAHDDTPPSLHVVTTEGDDHVIGDGATQVAGSAADVVLWLARGRTDGVSFDGPVPTLPFGG
ncbi:maleylpyruvate isomerase family mycothiol-dependent enzyme [Terrabacter sp. Ter38]|uniref:maleylpyruvate isomerase family mycothiol-dependent enzyme n=1 Tax=Terrabacter sp. Ter38 TaxID=2926030 RepID=UPI0021193A92|nr:maleylpyruvate isomerase family mycothiol-dependent enzyme [Terrabacter sp. Ter38]